MLSDKAKKWFPLIHFFVFNNYISTNETHLIWVRNVRRAVSYDHKMIAFSNSIQYTFLHVVSQDMNEFILDIRWQVPPVIICFFELMLSTKQKKVEESYFVISSTSPIKLPLLELYNFLDDHKKSGFVTSETSRQK